MARGDWRERDGEKVWGLGFGMWVYEKVNERVNGRDERGKCSKDGFREHILYVL